MNPPTPYPSAPLWPLEIHADLICRLLDGYAERILRERKVKCDLRLSGGFGVHRGCVTRWWFRGKPRQFCELLAALGLHVPQEKLMEILESSSMLVTNRIRKNLFIVTHWLPYEY